jgi:hypothetical protein
MSGGDLKVQVAVGDTGGGGGGSVGGGGGGGNADLCACLERLLGGQPGSQGAQQQKEIIKQGTINAHKDPSFMSIFRPLLALEGLKDMVRNSTLANTYLGAMGKVFEAAIDLLLLPFTPMLSGLLILMAKLLPTMMKISDFLSSAINSFVDWIKTLASDFKDIWNALKDPSKWFSTLPGAIVQGLKDLFKGIADPKTLIGGVAAVGGAAVIGQMGMGALGLGALGPLALGKSLLGKMFSGGAAGGAAGEAGVAGDAAAGAGGMGLLGMGALGIGGGLLAGGGAYGNIKKGVNPFNTMEMVGGGAMLGAAIGAPFAGVGAIPGAMLGGLGGGLAAGAIGLGQSFGLFGGSHNQQPGQGGNNTNTNSGTIVGTLNANITVNATDMKSINDVVNAVTNKAARSTMGPGQ